MPNERSPRPTNRARDRSTPGPTYTLDELCTLGNVTVRTIRYYISEGLLPPPTGHGTSARYTQDHLDRLAVIGAMKERYLPLREIRRSLDAMSSRDIRETAGLVRQQAGTTADAIASTPMLQAPESEPPAARNAIREPSSAADYIADVLDRDHPPRRLAVQFPAPSPEPEATAWHRIPIIAGAELLIEEDIYTRRREQIDSLVSWAKRILTGT